jgi:hypothetical protein
MEPIECSETSAISTQTPGKHKKNILFNIRRKLEIKKCNQVLKEGRDYKVKQERQDEANIRELQFSGMFAMSVLVQNYQCFEKYSASNFTVDRQIGSGGFWELLLSLYKPTRRHITEDSNLTFALATVTKAHFPQNEHYLKAYR